MLGIEWVGTFLFSIIMLLSNVGGIGGGGIAIPMVQIFFGWDDLKKAIAISSFSIFISTLTRFFWNFNERHPEKPNMSSLDYGLASVMMPLTLIGTQVGAFLYLVCPVLIINIILTLLLLYLWIKSMKKAVQVYQEEKETEYKMKQSTLFAQNDAYNQEVGPNGSIMDTSLTAGDRTHEGLTTGETTKDAIVEEKDEFGLPKEPAIGNPNSHNDIIELRNLRQLIIQEKGHFIWKK